MKRNNIIIVVEGTDGSGKSFIINSITPWLEKLTGKDVIYYHLRPNLLPEIGVLLGKRASQDANQVNSNPHSKKQSGLIGSLFRWCYYLIDYTLGYFINVFCSGKNIFIFDRYYYDYYIDQKRSRTNLPYWILKLGEWLVPSPTISLCLGGDPEKIYARKPETSLEEVKRQTNILKNFCKQKKNAVWIDTTLQPEESIRDAKSAIEVIL